MFEFVDPVEVRLPLSDGQHYLIVKERLTYGEYTDMLAAMSDAQGDKVDPRKHAGALLAAYLVDWSLTDQAGRVVPIRHQSAEDITAAIRNLDFDDVQELVAVVTAHEERIKAARQEKKRSAGATVSSPIWPSRAAAAGGTSG